MKAFVSTISDHEVKVQCEKCSNITVYPRLQCEEGKYKKICQNCNEILEYVVDKHELFR